MIHFSFVHDLFRTFISSYLKEIRNFCTKNFILKLFKENINYESNKLL